MGALEPWHLIVILVIVLVLFGAGRLGEVGGALGKGIREFKSATKDDEPAGTPPSPISAVPVGETKCPSCGTVNPSAQAFCGQCGSQIRKSA